MNRMAADDAGVQRSVRYGILGGTFDPPHLGHLVLAQEAYTALSLDKVWFVPAGQPPHKMGETHTAAAIRRHMVELAIAGDERFGLCTVELLRAGPSYTVDTLRELRATWGPQVWICLILGWDMVSYFPNWHDPSGVLDQVDQIAAAHRPGYQVSDEELAGLAREIPDFLLKVKVFSVPQVDIAATMLRERVATGQPVRYLVPEAVWEHIEEHGLYQAMDSH
jgi:nicotinate-nucleotide adenylyltransferase